MTQTPVPPYGAPAPLPAAGQPQGRPRTSAAAVGAVVTASLALVPLAVVLGIVALFRIRKFGLRGRRAAVIALSMCAGWTALTMIGIIGAAAYVGQTRGPVRAFAVGKCFDWTNGQDATAGIDIVSCGDPHEGQIVGRYTLPGPFPGDQKAGTESVIGCTTDAARRIADVGSLDVGARVSTFIVDKQMWDDGMKDAVCVLDNAEGGYRSDDATDGSGLTQAQTAVLRATNEAALIRLKLGYATGAYWQDYAALDARLATVDLDEATALDRLADAPPPGASADLPTLLRALADADRTESPLAAASAAKISSEDTWRSVADSGQAYSSAAVDAYHAIHSEL